MNNQNDQNDQTDQNDQNANDQNDQNNQQDQNNDQNNIENFDDLWQDPKDENNQTQQTNNQQNTNDQTNQTSPNDRFDEHVNSLDFAADINATELAEQLQNGDFTGLNAAMESVARKTYKSTIFDMNKLIESRVSSAVDEAVQKTTGQVNRNMAVNKMRDALPFASKPSVAPIAEAVFSRFMQRGDDTEKAIENTRNFFAETNKLSAKDVGQITAPKPKPGERNFSLQNENSDEDPDWMKILTS